MTDEHPREREETAPLSAPGDDTWLPAREQTPPHHWAPPGPPPGPQGPPQGPPRTPDTEPTRPRTSPGHPVVPGRTAPPAEPPRGRVSGWVRPVVSVLALGIRLIGGVFGSGVREPPLELDRGSGDRRPQRGGTVLKAPLRPGNRRSRPSRSGCCPAPSRCWRSTRARRTGPPARASCSTGRATTSPTTTSSRTPPRATADRDVEQTATRRREGRRPDPTYDLAVLSVEGRAGPAAGEPWASAGARRRRPGRRDRLAPWAWPAP